MTRKEKAMQSFLDGYNCSQCMVLAFEDLLTIDVNTALKIASPFGGGMGRTRSVCGAVSGMYIVLGFFRGYDSPEDFEGKKRLYSEIQELAVQFKDKYGSIVCRDLLKGIAHTDGAEPEKRTADYYKKRPCAEQIEYAAYILNEFLILHGNI